MTSIPHVTPEHLPGEPTSPPPRLAPALAGRLIGLTVASLLCAALLAPYLLYRLFWRRPPNVASAAYHVKVLGWILFDRPPAPGLSLTDRTALLLHLAQLWLMVPTAGLAWALDDLLYGRTMRDVKVIAPLYEVSAARSGSTQLGHYLEDDPHLVAPCMAQIAFPYLWLWRLARRMSGRRLSRDTIAAAVRARVPPDLLERHELEPFRTDTFEVLFLMTHLHSVTFRLGPKRLMDVWAPGRAGPNARELWEDDFVAYVEAVGRKTLHEAAPGPDGRPRRLLIKGHFLHAARLLATRAPDARFLTVLRKPARRIQSLVNHLRAQPFDPLVGPVPWAWLVEGVLQFEADYNDVERVWFDQLDPSRRCVVRFEDYVADLEGTMRRVYSELLDIHELPPHVPTQHAPRKRHNYRIDRSLADLGIDREALDRRFEDWMAWYEQNQ